MTRASLRNGLISEETITYALMAARGDLFITAMHLGVTAREVNTYVRDSDQVRAFVAAIKDVKATAEYDRMTGDDFEVELERVAKSYKMEGLEAIHEIATMDFGESAAMAEVKLKAAIQLRGAPEVKATGGDNSVIMAELNRLYQESAPRIRSVRVAQIEFEG